MTGLPHTALDVPFVPAKRTRYAYVCVHGGPQGWRKIDKVRSRRDSPHVVPAHRALFCLLSLWWHPLEGLSFPACSSTEECSPAGSAGWNLVARSVVWLARFFKFSRSFPLALAWICDFLVLSSSCHGFEVRGLSINTSRVRKNVEISKAETGMFGRWRK